VTLLDFRSFLRFDRSSLDFDRSSDWRGRRARRAAW